MLRAFAIIPLVMILALIVVCPPASAEQAMPIDPATCLQCHGEKICSAAFAASVHGKNSCTSCHVGHCRPGQAHLREIRPAKGTVRALPQEGNHRTLCQRPHAEQHIPAPTATPTSTPITYWKNDKRIVVAKCQSVPRQGSVLPKSVHGKAVMAGNQDSPPATTATISMKSNPRGSETPLTTREFHTKVCMKCHSDEKMMKRNKVFNVAVKTTWTATTARTTGSASRKRLPVAPTATPPTRSFPAKRPEFQRQSGQSGQDLWPVPSQGHAALYQILCPWRTRQTARNIPMLF